MKIVGHATGVGHPSSSTGGATGTCFLCKEHFPCNVWHHGCVCKSWKICHSDG